MMRPLTSSQHSRSVLSSSRSDALSVRSKNLNAPSSVVRPFTSLSSQRSIHAGKHAINLPSEEVKISERPVTAAGGLGGLPQQRYNNNSFHQNRHIQDASYFYSLLQSKEKALAVEIQKLNKQIQTLQSHKGQRNIEVLHQDLLKEVRDLEGLLADHSVAHDKIRRGCDQEELESLQFALHVKNENLANDLDEIFVAKQQCEKNIEKVERSIEQMHKVIKNRFQNADVSVFNEYQKNTIQIKDLQIERKAIETELEQMRSKLHNLLSVASNNEDYETREQYALEVEKVENLRSDLADIEENLRVAQMAPEDAHAHLLAKVKSSQAKLNELTVEEKSIMEQIEIESAAASTICESRVNDDLNKEEIDKSIQVAKETITKLAQDQEKKQNEIFSFLDYLNQDVEQFNSIQPTQEGLKLLSHDVDFRAKHLANSQQTMQRLEEQKAKRLREVEIVKNLEGKILSEDNELKRKIEIMRNETTKYSDLKSLQESSEITKLYLAQMKERYRRRGDFIKSKVRMLSTTYEKNKLSLDKNETWKSLLNLEEKMRRQGQVIFSLQEGIKRKEQQTNYDKMKKECLDIMITLSTY